MSDEIIKPLTTSDNSLASALSYIANKTRVDFNGSCLRQNKFALNIYIIYEISVSDSNNSCPTLENCLFGAVKLTKILILISTNILDMVLDLIDVELFHFLLVNSVAM